MMLLLTLTFLAVVNLTLIDLPGLTKVAVGNLFEIFSFLYWTFKKKIKGIF